MTELAIELIYFLLKRGSVAIWKTRTYLGMSTSFGPTVNGLWWQRMWQFWLFTARNGRHGFLADGHSDPLTGWLLFSVDPFFRPNIPGPHAICKFFPPKFVTSLFSACLKVSLLIHGMEGCYQSLMPVLFSFVYICNLVFLPEGGKDFSF